MIDATTQINDALRRTNYRRRVRTVNINDVSQAIREAVVGGVGYVSGGAVARAYKYPADTAAVAAVRVDNFICVKVGSHDAKGSPVMWFGPASSRDRDLTKWAEQVTFQHLMSNSWIFLTRRDVVTILRATRAPRVPAPDVPEVTVTVEDSLASGNCEHETQRIADDLHVTSCSSRRLVAFIARREPHLMRYALRAVEHAVNWKAQVAKEMTQ